MRPMTRLLLAFLALLTGLAAQNSAQAGACAPADTEIGAVAGASMAQPRAALVTLAHSPVQPDELRAAESVQPVAPHFAPMVLTVLQGVDRARE